MASEISITQASVLPEKLQEGVERTSHKVASSLESKRIELKQVAKQADSEQEESFQKDELKVEEDIFSFMEKKDEEAELTEKVSQLNDFVQNMNRDLQFSVDKDSGQTVVTVVDSKTEEIIRKIPSEEVLRIRQSLENLSGLLLKERA